MSCGRKGPVLAEGCARQSSRSISSWRCSKTSLQDIWQVRIEKERRTWAPCFRTSSSLLLCRSCRAAVCKQAVAPFKWAAAWLAWRARCDRLTSSGNVCLGGRAASGCAASCRCTSSVHRCAARRCRAASEGG